VLRLLAKLRQQPQQPFPTHRRRHS
jgi:hypothetical protein